MFNVLMKNNVKKYHVYEEFENTIFFDASLFAYR